MKLKPPPYAAIVLAAEPNMPAATTQMQIITPNQAREAINAIQPPTGVKLTGTIEPLPSTNIEQTNTDANDKLHHEQRLGRAWGPWRTWGRWGRWGGFGPYGFRYSCGGLNGWAYPLGYWNTFGAGSLVADAVLASRTVACTTAKRTMPPRS